MASVSYMFTLEVDDFDIDDEDFVSRFTGDGIEAYPASIDGQVLISYKMQSDHPFDAVLDAINHLKKFDQGVEILRVVADLVNISDIADRIGSSRETVRSWVTAVRGPGGFPRPYATVGRGVRIWDWPDVNEWLKQNHPELSDDEYSIPRLQLDWINSSLTRMQRELGHESLQVPVYNENSLSASYDFVSATNMPRNNFYTVLMLPHALPQIFTSGTQMAADDSQRRYWTYCSSMFLSIFRNDSISAASREEGVTNFSGGGQSCAFGRKFFWSISGSEARESDDVVLEGRTYQVKTSQTGASENTSSSLVAYPEPQEASLEA